MPDETQSIQTFVAWADIPSALLLAISIALGGLTPVRPLWGRPLFHNVLFATAMTLQTVYTIVRFVLEGIYEQSGPREFMASSVVYTTRLVFLWAYITFQTTVHGKLFQVARELRWVKLLRKGTSTSKARYGQPELVMRTGCRDAGDGPMYWRGIVESISQDNELWVVHLKESALNAEKLDVIGTTEFRQDKAYHKDAAYKLFYEIVMTVCQPNVYVDFSLFFEHWSGVDLTEIARRVGALDETDLGRVARRIAADGIYYATNRRAEMRTKRQVALLNSCIQDAFERIRDGSPDMVGTPSRAPFSTA